MNCEDRLEQLLGQAGQTIADLPKAGGIGMPYMVQNYDALLREAANFVGIELTPGFEVLYVFQYALHLADVIDRLEWALDNTIRERDWLRRMCERSMTPCDLCRYGERQMDVQPCASCTTFDTGDQYEFGLPEDTKAEEDGDGLG